MLDLSNQMEALRDEVAAMRGQGEALARDLADMQRNQEGTTPVADERLRSTESTKVTVDGKEFVAEPAETQQFDVALVALRQGEVAQAQADLVSFIKHYPQSGYKSSALF